ncbi:MAG TPA: ABC transporter ATP-binding protein [bacterium]|nr:ABC transporter ATP-binding protein [bacterium]
MSSAGLYWRVLSFLRPYWRLMAAAIVLMVLCAIFNGFSIGMILPFINVIFSGGKLDPAKAMGKVPSKLLQNAPHSITTIQEVVRTKVLALYASPSPLVTLERIFISILVLYLLKGLFTYLLAIVSAQIEQVMIRDVRNHLYRHLHKLSLAFFHRSRTGTVISVVTNDVSLLRMTITAGFLNFFRDLVLVLVYAAMVVWISWRLSLVAFVVIPVITFLVSRLGKRLRRYTTRAQEKMADMTGVLQETLSGIRVVKAFGMERFETDKFERHTQGYYRAFLKQQRAASLAPPTTEFLGAVGLLVVVWYGGRQVLGGGFLSPDWFLIFLAAMLSIIQPAKNLSYASTRIQEGLAAAKRIFTLLDTKPDIVDPPGAIEFTTMRQGLEMRGVSFKYGGSDYVLRDIDLKVTKGQVIALVGPSGAGKSTLVDLIPRFYDPTDGSVSIDGIDIRKASVRSLRNLMGIVTQEVILFNDSVRNNIAYGVEDIAFERIVAAAKAANAHEFIEGLAQGYETMIGDRGVRLSGGERQRIAIARAILKDPEILIFDEATSSLDSESERLVQDAIQRLMSNRTSFVIAHRLSTITNSDVIVVLEDGRITEAGKHEDLLAANGVYRRLYDLQFKDFPQVVEEGP